MDVPLKIHESNMSMRLFSNHEWPLDGHGDNMNVRGTKMDSSDVIVNCLYSSHGPSMNFPWICRGRPLQFRYMCLTFMDT